MEIERGWWVPAQNGNKWGLHTDRQENVSFLECEVTWGAKMSLWKWLFVKRGTAILPIPVISIADGLVDIYVSISEILLRTKSNDLKASMQLPAHPCLPTVIGK